MIHIVAERDKTKFQTLSSGTLQRLRRRVQKDLVEWIRDYVRRRIEDFSLGAGGTPLEGYSTSPLRVPYVGVPKRHKRPVGGVKTRGGMFFKGGYKEYKEKAGLVSNRFDFKNTRDAWRDWRVLVYGDLAGTSEIGFSDVNNAIAANAAQDKRPLLFSLDASELSVINAEVITMINERFFPV